MAATGVEAKKGGGGKPGGNDGVDGAACVDSGSYFPAFAYEVSDFSKKGAFELYLANAEGDCSIMIYKGNYSFNGDISYRYYKITRMGKIAWAQNKDGHKRNDIQNAVIRLLTFEVEDEAIMGVLPLSSELLYVTPQSSPYGGVSGVELSPSGDKIVFEEWRDYSDHYLWELDLTSLECTDPCLEKIFESHTGINDNAKSPAYNLDGDRVYFELGNFDTDIHNIAFIEKIGSLWSDEIIFKTYSNGVVYGDLAVGLWDWDFQGDAREVVAFSRRFGGGVRVLEILDVENCLTNSIIDPCVVVDGIPGAEPSFTNFSADLLYLFEDSTVTGPSVREYDLDGGTWRTVMDVITGGSNRIHGVDGAD